MTKSTEPNPELAVELTRVREDFLSATNEDQQLFFLLLVDPVHAFSKAGIKISNQARQYIRNTYAEKAFGNVELYEKILEGRAQVRK